MPFWHLYFPWRQAARKHLHLIIPAPKFNFAAEQPRNNLLGLRLPWAFVVLNNRNNNTFPIVSDLDNEDSTATREKIDSFLTRDSRNTFIARVYAILSTQLVFTAMVITFFGVNPGISKWMRDAGRLVPFLSLGLSTIAWFAVATSTKARREAPLKWQLLALFTIGEAISVGFISSFYKFQTVVTAMLATTAATTGVSLYTMLQQDPKYDLSQWGAGLSSVGIVFLVYGLINLLELRGSLAKRIHAVQ